MCADDSADNSEGDEAGILRGGVSKSDPTRTCHVRRQSSPDVSVPLNLTLKQSPAASPLHLTAASSRPTKQLQQRRDEVTHSLNTPQRSAPAETSPTASTHDDEARLVIHISPIGIKWMDRVSVCMSVCLSSRLASSVLHGRVPPTPAFDSADLRHVALIFTTEINRRSSSSCTETA